MEDINEERSFTEAYQTNSKYALKHEKVWKWDRRWHILRREEKLQTYISQLNAELASSRFFVKWSRAGYWFRCLVTAEELDRDNKHKLIFWKRLNDFFNFYTTTNEHFNEENKLKMKEIFVVPFFVWQIDTISNP